MANTTLPRTYENFNEVFGISLTKKYPALTHFEKGDYRTDAALNRDILQSKDSINNTRYASQINEFRTIYELDRIHANSGCPYLNCTNTCSTKAISQNPPQTQFNLPPSWAATKLTFTKR